MKVLLDECVPVQVRPALAAHKVFTAVQMGWSGLSNGDLLDAAERGGFDLIVVAGKNMRLVTRYHWQCLHRLGVGPYAI